MENTCSVCGAALSSAEKETGLCSKHSKIAVSCGIWLLSMFVAGIAFFGLLV